MQKTISPGQVRLGDRQIRIFYYRKENDENFVSNVKLPSFDTVLYLGSDVLSDCEHILPRNHGRTHARYAKKGLASKLTFTNARVFGINNSSSLWFYNVQGLFEVVFEHYSKKVQRDCLLSLKDEWLRSYEDMPLEESMHVTVSCVSDQDAIRVQSGDCDTFCLDAVLRGVIIELSTQMNSFSLSERHLAQVLLDMLSSYLHDLGTIKHGELQGFPFYLLENYYAMLCNTNLNQSSIDSFGITSERAVALQLLCEWIGLEFSKLNDPIGKRVERFKIQHINCIDNLPPAEKVVEELFPKSMILLIEKWMGGTEALENSKTEHSVSSDHTYCPPKQAAKVRDKTNIVANEDHTYCPPKPKLPKTSNTNSIDVYPFIQLILEFANNCLISGVAHVVYTRLRHL